MLLRKFKQFSRFCFSTSKPNSNSSNRAQEYRSPYVPKLIELDTRYALIRPNMRVLEIGCYPGGWTQYLVSKTGSTKENPLVVSLDIKNMEEVPGSIFVHGDISDEYVFPKIEKALKYQKVDLVFR